MSIERFIRKEEFHHYFQPIYNLEVCCPLGYEVLLRSNVYSNPETAFLEAKKIKQLYELDTRSIHKAIHSFKTDRVVKKERTLFLNIFPSTILNKNFRSFLDKMITENHLHYNQQIVLEISETEMVEEFDLFKTKIKELKEKGFLIAVDDIGQGYSNFKAIIELEPDYLKLDRYFSENLSSSKQKQSIISFFLSFCQQEKSQLILEGLENEKDLATAKALGIGFGQGYVLGKPSLLKASV